MTTSMRPQVQAITTRDVEHLATSLDALQLVVRQLKEIIVGRPAIDLPTTFISSTQFWTIDYKERKHVFIWLPVSATLSFEDWGSGTVQAQVWVNIGIPAGVRVFAPNNVQATNPLQINVRCTDEVIP